MIAAMNALMQAIEKAEAFLVPDIGDEAWETLEDLPSEAKSHPRVLELRLECLGVLKEWQKAVFLGEGIVAALPKSALTRFWLACGLAQTGRLEDAREHAKEVVRLNPNLRLRMLDEPSLAGVVVNALTSCRSLAAISTQNSYLACLPFSGAWSRYSAKLTPSPSAILRSTQRVGRDLSFPI
jgi:hypothetical protein